MEDNKKTNESRRDFVKKAAYVAPAIVTLSALPTMHAHGSIGQQPGGDNGDNDQG